MLFQQVVVQDRQAEQFYLDSWQLLDKSKPSESNTWNKDESKPNGPNNNKTKSNTWNKGKSKPNGPNENESQADRSIQDFSFGLKFHLKRNLTRYNQKSKDGNSHRCGTHVVVTKKTHFLIIRPVVTIFLPTLVLLLTSLALTLSPPSEMVWKM